MWTIALSIYLLSFGSGSIRDPGPSLRAEVMTPTGGVTGTVTDADCGTPIPWANVIVTGTGLGSVTDATGSYVIENVPVGEYEIRVMMMTHKRAKVAGVRVTEGGSAAVSFSVGEIWGRSLSKTPTRDPGRCGAHGEQLVWVLAPVGYGLIVGPEPDYRRAAQDSFPNAEPWEHAGCVISTGSPMKTWVGRCRRCVKYRNRWLNKSSAPWETAVDASGWQDYEFADIATLRMPEVREVPSQTSGCRVSQTWESSGLRVSVYFGPAILAPVSVDSAVMYESAEIVGATYPTVNMISDEESGGYVLYARFWATRHDTKRLVLRLWLRELVDAGKALEVVRSIQLR